MKPLETCAWCGATDQLLVRLKQGTPVNACADWRACGERELKKSATTESIFDAPFGRQRKNAANLFGRPTT
jgi:hypothetical protein